MNYRSKAAAIACVAIVGIGMTGCGDSNSTQFQVLPSADGDSPVVIVPPVETPTGSACPIPEAVQQSATLDLDKTKLALSTALVSAEIGYMLSEGDRDYDSASPKSAQEPKEVSKLASALSTKIKTLQKNTALVKKTISGLNGDPIIYGDDIACDSGTYSAYNDNIEPNEEVDEETYTEKLTLSFDECVLEKNANESLVNFFNDTIMSSSVFNSQRLNVASEVYTYNGSLSLEYNEAYAYTDWSTPPPAPTDHGDGYKETYEGTTHLITNALSMEYKEDGTLRGVYTSTQELILTFNGSYGYSTTTIYDSIEAFNDGNYTYEYTYDGKDNTSVTFEGSETYQSFGESNETISLTALCYTAEIASNYGNSNKNNYIVNSWDSSEYTEHDENSVQSSGYLALSVQSGEEKFFFDVYSDELKVNSTYQYSSSNESFTESSTFSMNGTVGSMLIGGSVALDTQSPWLMSSEHSNNRYEPTESMGGYYFDYTPYAGKTVMTGTNTATVEFMFDEDRTYGVITVEGEEPVEYDSIDEMFGLEK